MRLEHFNQASPADQMTALIGALDGEIDNLKDGFTADCNPFTRADLTRRLDSLSARLDDLRALQDYLPVSWDIDPKIARLQPGKTLKLRKDLHFTNYVTEQPVTLPAGTVVTIEYANYQDVWFTHPSLERSKTVMWHYVIIY